MSCSYIKDEHICAVDNSPCPFIYWCSKQSIWRPNDSMPKQCKVAQNVALPKGEYKVVGVRKGYLYVEIGNFTYKLANPFDGDMPLTVKVRKQKDGTYKVQK